MGALGAVSAGVHDGWVAADVSKALRLARARLAIVSPDVALRLAGLRRDLADATGGNAHGAALSLGGLETVVVARPGQIRAGVQQGTPTPDSDGDDVLAMKASAAPVVGATGATGVAGATSIADAVARLRSAFPHVTVRDPGELRRAAGPPPPPPPPVDWTAEASRDEARRTAVVRDAGGGGRCSGS